MRDGEENGVLHAGRVFQQYSVDEFMKLETQRLDFYSFNQGLFRIDALAGILDVLRHGEREPCNIGRQSFLSASFIGGPRDIRRRYMDAIALVQNSGKPDIFLTMTYNPSWPEIEEHLLVTNEVQNRPDLVSRVFRAKVEDMKTDILKRNIFLKVAAFMYTTEFQKRGLPHAHLLKRGTISCALSQPGCLLLLNSFCVHFDHSEVDVFAVVPPKISKYRRSKYTNKTRGINRQAIDLSVFALFACCYYNAKPVLSFVPEGNFFAIIFELNNLLLAKKEFYCNSF